MTRINYLLNPSRSVYSLTSVETFIAKFAFRLSLPGRNSSAQSKSLLHSAIGSTISTCQKPSPTWSSERSRTSSSRFLDSSRSKQDVFTRFLPLLHSPLRLFETFPTDALSSQISTCRLFPISHTLLALISPSFSSRPVHRFLPPSYSQNSRTSLYTARPSISKTSQSGLWLCRPSSLDVQISLGSDSPTARNRTTAPSFRPWLTCSLV